MQAVHTHAPGRIAQALAHEPAQRLDLRHLVALDHIAKEHAVHIALQQFDARGEREPLRLRESPLDQKLAEALLDERSLDWCRPKGARRESLRADEPETTSSMRSVSSTRRQKRSHPGTSWISSRNQCAVCRPRNSGCVRKCSSSRSPSCSTPMSASRLVPERPDGSCRRLCCRNHGTDRRRTPRRPRSIRCERRSQCDSTPPRLAAPLDNARRAVAPGQP